MSKILALTCPYCGVAVRSPGEEGYTIEKCVYSPEVEGPKGCGRYFAANVRKHVTYTNETRKLDFSDNVGDTDIPF